MRPTLGHTRPLVTRYRPAPLVPGSLAWTIAEIMRAPMQTLRDTEVAFMAHLPVEGDAPVRYSSVWSASDAEMTRFVESGSEFVW